MDRARRTCAVIVADDFGRSTSVNSAIAQAHERGIVTSASIMAGGDAFEEAVQIAKSHPRLSVGLHVTLCDGRAVLPHTNIPELVDAGGSFEKDPSRAWIKYSAARRLLQIEREMEAQFGRLEAAGIHPSHVDGHHHMHMQPAVFSILCRLASRRLVHWVRIPTEPFSLLMRSQWYRRGAMSFIEWAVFGLLGISHRRKARSYGLNAIRKSCGLSRTGHVDEKYLLGVLAGNGGLSEIFVHPDEATDAGKRELEALISPAVCHRLSSASIAAVGYRDLSEQTLIHESAEGKVAKENV